jgi:hypothetical protein
MEVCVALNLGDATNGGLVNVVAIDRSMVDDRLRPGIVLLRHCSDIAFVVSP